MDDIIEILSELEMRSFCGCVNITIDGGFPVDIRVEEDDDYGDDDVPDLVDIFEGTPLSWDDYL